VVVSRRGTLRRCQLRAPLISLECLAYCLRRGHYPGTVCTLATVVVNFSEVAAKMDFSKHSLACSIHSRAWSFTTY
jgi:hypothetical protein